MLSVRTYWRFPFMLSIQISQGVRVLIANEQHVSVELISSDLGGRTMSCASGLVWPQKPWHTKPTSCYWAERVTNHRPESHCWHMSTFICGRVAAMRTIRERALTDFTNFTLFINSMLFSISWQHHDTASEIKLQLFRMWHINVLHLLNHHKMRPF